MASIKPWQLILATLPLLVCPLTVDLSNSNPKLITFQLPSNVSHLVTSLTLQSNHLSNSTADWFKNLTAVSTLNMNYNSMKMFPNLTFIGNTIVNLYLRGNVIAEIPYSLMDVLVKLGHIDMRENRLSTVPDPVGPANTIRSAYFHNNQIRNLTIFTNLGSSIENLQFDRNQITEIPPGFFIALKRVTLINLNSNKLTTFPNFTVVMSTIQQIHIYGNKISSVSFEAIENLRYLRLLNIGGNLLTTFPTNTTNPFTHLYLHYCKFTSYPNLENYGNTLQLFHFQGNYVGKPDPEMFKPLSRLTHLYIGVNNIDSFPNLTYISGTLRLLSLYNNKITSIPGDLLNSLTQLYYLDLQWNKLTQLDISQLPKLTDIRLRGNPLNDLPKMADTGMQQLLISNIGLTSIDTSKISSLTKLKYLYLHQNSITHFPDVRFAEASLIRVYLYSNKLHYIDPQYFVFPNNNQHLIIKVNDNQLYSVPEIVAPTSKSVTLDISGNPLHCNMSLAWIFKIPSKYNIVGTCSTPESLSGSLLSDIPNLKMMATPAVSVLQGQLVDNWEPLLADNSTDSCAYIKQASAKFPSPCSADQSKLVLKLSDPKALGRGPVAVNVSTTGGSCDMSHMLVYTSTRDYNPEQCNDYVSDDVTWTASLCTVEWSEEGGVHSTCSYHCDHSPHLFIAIGRHSGINHVCDVSYRNI